MSTFALVDATTHVHGHDFTTDLNQIGLNIEAEELDNTAFGGGGYRSRIGGLKTVSSEVQGFWQSAPDNAVFGDLGVRDRAVTMTPDGAEGSVAYMFQAGKFTYQAFGAIGEVTPFSLTMMGTSGTGVVRGRLGAAKQNVSSTGTLGSAVNLGAVGSSQSLYAAVHVFTAGTSVTIDVESDSTSSFGSATDRATIGPLTSTGGTWMTPVAGSISDTWFRLNVTAVTGTFNLAVALGVQ